MQETNDDSHADTDPAAQRPARLPGFDSRTNFSILGWILDRLRKGSGSEQQIDLTLD